MIIMVFQTRLSIALQPFSRKQWRGEKPSEFDYGRVGTPTSQAFEKAVSALYGADDTISTPSGLSAVVSALLAFAKSGDHILFPDSLYGSSRRFVTKMLANYGMEITFYPARINGNIIDFIKENTAILYLESPGSLTFELQDIPLMVDIAKKRGITTLIDNTWGTALHHNALDKGVDVVIEAATKYITGHADVNLGIACARGHHAKILRQSATMLGICAGPEDLYLGLRGLRTMSLRLKQSERNAKMRCYASCTLPLKARLIMRSISVILRAHVVFLDLYCHLTYLNKLLIRQLNPYHCFILAPAGVGLRA